MKVTANSFKGRWKIVWMEMWNQDFVDEEVPGHVTFGDKSLGEFQFGYVCGSFTWSVKNGCIDLGSRCIGTQEPQTGANH